MDSDAKAGRSIATVGATSEAIDEAAVSAGRSVSISALAVVICLVVVVIYAVYAIVGYLRTATRPHASSARSGLCCPRPGACD